MEATTYDETNELFIRLWMMFTAIYENAAKPTDESIERLSEQKHEAKILLDNYIDKRIAARTREVTE